MMTTAKMFTVMSFWFLAVTFLRRCGNCQRALSKPHPKYDIMFLLAVGVTYLCPAFLVCTVHFLLLIHICAETPSTATPNNSAALYVQSTERCVKHQNQYITRTLQIACTMHVYKPFTVLTRNYGGAYNWICVISLVYTPPFLDTVVCDKCNSSIM